MSANPDEQTAPDAQQYESLQVGDPNEHGTGPVERTLHPNPEAPYGLTAAGEPRKRPARHGEGARALLTPHMLQSIRRLARAAMTEQEIRKALQIDDSVWSRWYGKPVFLAALRPDDDASSERVERTVLQRALGSVVWADRLDSKSGQVVRLEAQLPPDTEAAKLWLHNRSPARWKAKAGEGVSGLTVIINAPMIHEALAGRNPSAVEDVPAITVLPAVKP